MYMADASTYLYLPQFLSSMSYSFLSTYPLLPWLNLFLDTLFFVAIVNRTVFLVSHFDSLLLVYKNAINF